MSSPDAGRDARSSSSIHTRSRRVSASAWCDRAKIRYEFSQAKATLAPALADSLFASPPWPEARGLPSGMTISEHHRLLRLGRRRRRPWTAAAAFGAAGFFRHAARVPHRPVIHRGRAENGSDLRYHGLPAPSRFPLTRGPVGNAFAHAMPLQINAASSMFRRGKSAAGAAGRHEFSTPPTFFRAALRLRNLPNSALFGRGNWLAHLATMLMSISAPAPAPRRFLTRDGRGSA